MSTTQDLKTLTESELKELRDKAPNPVGGAKNEAQKELDRRAALRMFA